MVFHSKVTKHIKKTYKHVFISVLGIGFIALMITGIMHYRYIFTTDKDNTVINTQLSFFDVTNSPLLAKYSQHLANQLTPLEQQFIKKYFIQMSKEEKSFARKKQKFVLQNKHPIEIPIVPKKKMKNIIFFVIDTTRYDVFQMVVKKDPWLRDFIKSNISFTNHYSGAPLSLNSVLVIMIGYHPFSLIPFKSKKLFNTRVYDYYENDYEAHSFLGKDHIKRAYRQYYPLLVRAITKNYPGDRLLLAGHECSAYTFYPPSWCANTKARFVYNKTYNLIAIWNSVTAFMNMLQGDPTKPFIVYFQPQTVHGNGTHRLVVPYAHVAGVIFDHEKALKGSADSVEVSVLAFKYMVQELKARGLYDNTIIILTSDHGELYGEYGLRAHGNWLDETLLHVPLVIHWPRKKPHVYTHKTSHYDLVPTLMKEYFGYKGDAKTISIGKNLFDATKSWKYLPVSVWSGSVGLFSDNTCFAIQWTLHGCIPTRKASGVNVKSMNLLYGYLTQHVNGFGPLPKYRGDQ